MIPKHISFIIETLNKKGYEAYLVGGCVRDMLMGKAPDDFDITTSALPEETKNCFSAYQVVETGIKHGTVTLVMEEGCVEITTFRVDGEYKDSRHPERVTFTRSLTEDLARRDFTVNAMAFDGKEIKDPFGGRADLEKKILRCVGCPEKRFSEDALRIMRGIRFASSFGFSVEEETKKAIFKFRHLLKKVSAERIFSELKKLIQGEFAPAVTEEYFDVLNEVMPLGKVPRYINALKGDLSFRLALFLWDCDEKVVLRALKCDKATEKEVSLLKEGAKNISAKSVTDIKRLVSRFAFTLSRKIIELSFLTGKLNNGERDIALSHLKSIEKNGDCCTLCQLKIKGSDLSAMGFKGAEIGEILQKLLDMVIEERLENRKDCLKDFVNSKNCSFNP